MSSYIIDNILNEVCLDYRVSDGIFRLDNMEHMDALRDHFVKRGVPLLEAIHITNTMVEGKFPERQAYRKEDGILVTWPSPKHKQTALQKPENSGKYVEENPFANQQTAQPTQSSPQDKAPQDSGGSVPKSDGPPEIKKTPNIFQDEPSKKPDSQQETPKEQEPLQRGLSAKSPPEQKIPKTPDEISSEKEVVKQMFNVGDSSVNQNSQISDTCKQQLSILSRMASEMNYLDAVNFLSKYIKS